MERAVSRMSQLGTDIRGDEVTSENNGGSTDYYQLKDSWKDAMDIVEDRGMNYAQGNILKVAFTFNIGRHEATTYERELNKIAFFVERELARIKHDE